MGTAGAKRRDGWARSGEWGVGEKEEGRDGAVGSGTGIWGQIGERGLMGWWWVDVGWVACRAGGMVW